MTHTIEQQMLAITMAKGHVRAVSEHLGQNNEALLSALDDCYDSLASIRFMQAAEELKGNGKELEGSGVKLDN